MRLVMECEHGENASHWVEFFERAFCSHTFVEITDPDAIVAALVEAGWLESERHRIRGIVEERFVSPWKEAK